MVQKNSPKNSPVQILPYVCCKCTLPSGMLSEWALSNNGTSYMVNLTFTWSFSLINWVDNVNWPPSIVSKLTPRALALRQSDWRNCGLCVCLPYLLNLNAALESSWFSRNVAWCLQVEHALEREISLLIWAIHSALSNFRFAINMATLNDAFHAIEQKRLLFRP